jgi:hypothetical protein
MIQNTGSTRLSIALGETAATGVGFSLSAGGSLTLSGASISRAEVNVYNEGGAAGAVFGYEYF